MQSRRDKIRLAIFFGGKSVEHEVAIASAKNINQAVDKNKYQSTLIFIDKSGSWRVVNENFFSDKVSNDIPPEPLNLELPDLSLLANIDVIFPVLHGPFGEDGTIQGLFKLAGIPFVGAGVLGSAVGMDKDVAKRLMREAGIPVVKFVSFRSKSVTSFERVQNVVGLPFFVKPANLGSSVGITKVSSSREFKAALSKAFSYDTKIVIEEFVEGREIECSVLGNEDLEISLPGEIIPNDEFYSYNAKYIDKDGAKLIIPARLEGRLVKEVQEQARRAFNALDCQGMARVDFFLKENGQLFVSEINTIPGFTNISMYPKLWGVSGIPYAELVDRLINLAIERFETEQKLKSYYPKA